MKRLPLILSVLLAALVSAAWVIKDTANPVDIFTGSNTTPTVRAATSGAVTIGIPGSTTQRLNGYGLLNFENADTAVATTDAYELRRTTTGTAAAGFGGRLAMSAENAAGNQPSAAYLQWELSNAGNGTEASKVSLWTRTGGAALAKQFEIAADGSPYFRTFGAGIVTSTAAGIATTSNAFTYTGGTSDATCSASPCAAGLNYGGFIDPTTRVSRASPGVYTVNFTAGFWSAAPACTVSSFQGNAHVCYGNGAASTSSWNVACYNVPGAALADSRFYVTCTGPRS